MAYAEIPSSGKIISATFCASPWRAKSSVLHDVECGVPYFDPWDTGSDPKELVAIG